jgi:hypothetical protein
MLDVGVGVTVSVGVTLGLGGSVATLGPDDPGAGTVLAEPPPGAASTGALVLPPGAAGVLLPAPVRAGPLELGAAV